MSSMSNDPIHNGAHESPHPERGVSSGESDAEELPLEVALEAAADVLLRSLDSEGSGEVDFERLEGLYDSAAQVMGGSDEGESNPDSPPRGEQREVETESGLSLDELREEILGLEESVQTPLCLESLYLPEEELSILLQALPTSPNEEIRSATVARLVQVLDRVPSPLLQPVATGALREYLEEVPHELLDRVAPILNWILRQHHIPLLQQLAALGRQVSSAAREALWPHVAAELLATPPGSPSDEIDCWLLLDDLQDELVPDAMRRLGQLSVLRQKELVPGCFRPQQKHGYGLFSALLTSPFADLVGQEVFEGIRDNPPEDLGTTVTLRVLGRYRPEYASFLSRVLRDIRRDQISSEAHALALPLLLRGLSRLDANRQSESWVPGAIDWIGERGYLPAQEFLTRVVKQRKGLRHMWPSKCRKAAKRALAAITSQGMSS